MGKISIATWNVNSLRVRLAHVLSWLKANKPTVLALQETKLTDADFPLAPLAEAGYHAIFSGQRTYNGMAILSSEEMVKADVLTDIPGLVDPQRRMLAVSIHGIRIVNLYVPNGQEVGSEKYQYKLNWLKKVRDYLKAELTRYPKLIVVGDFNIAPAPIDVHNPAAWEGKVLFSDKERAAFASLIELGLVDAYRSLSPQAQHYTWWDYRLFAFKRNMGLRIDHILMSKALFSHCKHCTIDKVPRSWERPSDHAPVMAELHFP